MPKILVLIFLPAILIRFLYFPDNVNFAYDQARDSFASLEILKGHLKIIGPPTTASDKIFHGALFYYILASIYLISGNSPEVAAGILTVINALGIFLVFYIASILFEAEAGLIAAFLFAISYEQSQYALFFGHPSPAAVSILIFYLGLALLIFKNKPAGFVISLLGLGLTIQFEDVNALLIVSFLIYLLFFYRTLKLLKFKIILFGLFAFAATTSSFILVELKYHFRTISSILDTINSFNTESSANFYYIFSVVKRLINDNFLANEEIVYLTLFLFIGTIIFMIKKNNLRSQAFFLLVWFLGGLIPHFIARKFSYYYSPGASVSLLILVSFLIYQVFLRKKVLAVFILVLIIFSNLNLVLKENIKGPNKDIVIQQGMLIGNQKKALDFIYTKSRDQAFAVSALTVPLNVKTTWDYLFNWYGKDKYGFTPVWYGDSADGFYGYLRVVKVRSDLPKKQFLIIEPTVGIDKLTVLNFLKEENYFTKVISEKQFGTITVQERERI